MIEVLPESSANDAHTPLPTMAPSPPSGHMRKRTYRAFFAALIVSQAFMGFMGAGDRFVLGHNGWNSSAYLQSARNTLRWGTLFPVQYYTGRTPPTVADGYTHHPLGMHLHNTLAVALFGDHEGTIRSVPAFFGVLALIALMIVVRLLYDERTSLIAGALWVLSPTNAIFTNMSNHENAFIFWFFLCGYCYLRFARARFPLSPADGAPWRKWYALTLVTFFWAAMWDWPAYYCALCLATHWLVMVIGRYRAARREPGLAARGLRPLVRDLALLTGFSAFVVVLFIGHFMLVRAVVGSLSELGGVFEARQNAGRAMMINHLKVVPLLMFTAPILLVSFGWFFHRWWQIFRGRLARRDVIAFTFAIAGLLHYYIFRGTAVIHEFWGWTLVPFTAIACAYVLGVAIDRSRAWVRARWPRITFLPLVATLVMSLLIVGNLAYRFVDLVPRGRAVGGSLWFVEHTRPVLEVYQSTRTMIRFAVEVKAETTRKTGVMYDPAFERTWGFEPRFAIALDREVVTQSLSKPPPERLGVSEGWVYLAPPGTLSERRLVELALMHPVMLFDDYVMVDLRRQETDVRVFRSEAIDRDLWTWYWGGPWADAVAPVRQPDAEAKLLQSVRDYRSAHPR